ncbi:AbrB/MazE/SpoVT family DNA-binding domain-containing protein [Candidatus Pacearchaeota archaeon]|nr:AbrB/MazE/SpoVT family DNA-binding domain-containing protein [Candidatus Pacearchaeota archaeon]
MDEKIELGTVSSRGQICIPNKIREEMGLDEGSRVLFFLSGEDTLLVKKVQTKTFEEITRPLREAPKKIREEDVVDLIHKIRKEKRTKM